jgi:predicted PurR-regulated permease PerM
MATKKIEIEVGVNTDQLDKAQVKLGQLKDLGKGLKIQYDIDGKPIDVVIDKSKNLQEQFKLVNRELKRTKEGTAEFALLAKTQNDIKDSLDRVNTKSRELFSTLSLIPGPVGDIFGKLNGVIGLLKTFSDFSIKDLNNQLKGFNNDLNSIIKGFLGIKDASKETNDSIKSNTSITEDNTQAQQDNNDAADDGTVATNAGTAANQKQTNVIKEQGTAVKDYTTILQEQKAIKVQELNVYEQERSHLLKNIETNELYNKTAERKTDIIGKVNKQYDDYVSTIKDEIFALDSEIERTQQGTNGLKAQDEALTKNTVDKKSNVVVTNQLSLATEAATFATNALSIALKGLGIGLVIAAVVYLFDKLVAVGSAIVTNTKNWLGYKSSAEQATIANQQLASSIDVLKRSLDETQDAIKSQTEILQNQAKMAGATENELYNIALNGYNKRVEANKEGRKKIESELRLLQVNAKITEEERVKQTKALEDELVKNGQKSNDLRIEGVLLVQNALIKDADKTREELKKRKDKIAEDSKKTQDEIKADTIKANDLLLKLQQENSVNILDTERKRQDQQLKVDKENEERDVNKLKVTEEIKGKLLEQIKNKYGLKIIELNKKRQEEDNKKFDEDEKKLQDYQNKIFEIVNNADENELSRNKASRAKKFEDDKNALEKDANFQKQSLEDKIRILMALEKGYKNDIQKLDDDDAEKSRDKNLKKLDDELKFLQIKGEALKEGTKSFYNNQRDILKTAEKKELADLDEKAIKEKLTIEQVEREKLAIKQKYLKAGKDITQQEIEALLQYATTVLGAAQNIVSDIGKVASLGQQVATEKLTKAYIEQNEYDKKTITNQDQQEAKLLANKKKFAQDEDNLKKKAFEENKKIQIAQAIISTLQSAISAYSSLAVIPIVGPVLGGIAAAAALVFGYKQVDLIKQTSYQSSLALSESETPSATTKTNLGRNYAQGGMIGGKRHAEGGTMIEAEKGEAIMTRGAVTMFAPLLSMMNQAGGGTSFNSNLMTTRQDNPIVSNPAQEQAPLIVKTYVVSQELTTEAQRQARLKNLSTI